MNKEEKTYFGTEEKVDLKSEMKDLKKKETSQLELVWKRFKRNKLALFGVGVVLSLIFMAIFAPILAPYDPLSTNVGDRRSPPSSEHLLGTDHLGRDTLSRLIYGSRMALTIALVIIAITGGIGIMLGLIAGAFGGWIDEIIMRIVDTFMAFPVLVFAAALAVSLGTGTIPVIIAVGLILWTRFARVTRGEVLSIKQEQFIESAEAIGENKINIIFRYIFLNILPSIVIVATIMMPSALLYSAALNYLGIGAQPPTPAWGSMINNGKDFMMYTPWQVTFSGLMIVITVLGFNFMGDGLRDALDPVRRGG